ncbi:MAG: polyphosphate polymerase domain-containing protein [Bacteroidales bacterium]
MNDDITHIVSEIKPISLDEMDSVKLLNRTDTKFVFAAHKLPSILEYVKNDYAVLHVDGNPFQKYETIYYDTPDKKMYHIHQAGKVNRYKVRHRTYLSSGIAFLEIKFKNNKKVTFKKRIPYDISQGLKPAQDFLQTHSPFSWYELNPASIVSYTRITLVDLKQGERITIDSDLSITNAQTHNCADFSHVCIIELKREKGKSNTSMAKALRKNRVFQKSMSKYAIGTAASHNDVRLNRFKKKLRYIEKLK